MDKKIFKAVAKDGKRIVFLTSQSGQTKKNFICEMRANGYKVNPMKVKRIEVFEYIMNKTDCYPWDWKIWELDKKGNIVNNLK